MQHEEIVTQLPANPSEIVYAITMETLLAAIVHRLGEEALTLTEEDLAEFGGHLTCNFPSLVYVQPQHFELDFLSASPYFVPNGWFFLSSRGRHDGKQGRDNPKSHTEDNQKTAD